MRGNCGVLCGGFLVLKTCQLFEIIFGVFPFWELVLRRRHTPGAKPLIFDFDWRAKAEALAYLEAKATAKVDSLWE
jgi:hypothetical protein